MNTDAALMLIERYAIYYEQWRWMSAVGRPLRYFTDDRCTFGPLYLSRHVLGDEWAKPCPN